MHELTAESINEKIQLIRTKGNISDGYHTFRELYDDRAHLLAIISLGLKDDMWISKLHHDGTMFDDSTFIIGIDVGAIDIRYHLNTRHWSLFSGSVKELDRAPEWHGEDNSATAQLTKAITF